MIKPYTRTPPKTPGWYWMLSKLDEMGLHSLSGRTLKKRKSILLETIRVCRVDYDVVEGKRQLCSIHPGGSVPLENNMGTMWGPRIKSWHGIIDHFFGDDE